MASVRSVRVSVVVILAAALPAACGGAPRSVAPGDRPVATATGAPAPQQADTPSAVADLEQALASVRERALAARFVIDELEVVDDPPGLRVGIRLREEQLFDEAAHRWVSTLFGRFDVPFAYDLTVRSPGGVAIFRFHFPRGGIQYGGDAPTARVPDEPPPASLDGPTDLSIAFHGWQGASTTRHLVCQPRPRGVADAARLCRRVLVDRWQLFVPQMTETQCSLAVVGSRVTVSGTLGGVAVETAYGGCTPAQRWFDAFEIDPDGRAGPPPTTTG